MTFGEKEGRQEAEERRDSRRDEGRDLGLQGEFHNRKAGGSILPNLSLDGPFLCSFWHLLPSQSGQA